MPCTTGNVVRIGVFFILTAAFIPGTIFSILAEKDGPEKSGAIIFSHERHLGAAGLDCSACHAAAAASRLGTDNLLPAEKTCLGCHERKDCGLCHRGPDGARELERIADYSPKFSHAGHRERGFDCRTCHATLSGESENQASGRLPEMKPCMECHDGKTADKSCIVCHEDAKGKIPENHQRADWLVRHVGLVLKDRGQSCLMCHTNEHCEVCHPGTYLIQ